MPRIDLLKHGRPVRPMDASPSDYNTTINIKDSGFPLGTFNVLGNIDPGTPTTYSVYLQHVPVEYSVSAGYVVPATANARPTGCIIAVAHGATAGSYTLSSVTQPSLDLATWANYLPGYLYLFQYHGTAPVPASAAPNEHLGAVGLSTTVPGKVTALADGIDPVLGMQVVAVDTDANVVLVRY